MVHRGWAESKWIPIQLLGSSLRAAEPLRQGFAKLVPFVTLVGGSLCGASLLLVRPLLPLSTSVASMRRWNHVSPLHHCYCSAPSEFQRGTAAYYRGRSGASNGATPRGVTVARHHHSKGIKVFSWNCIVVLVHGDFERSLL